MNIINLPRRSGKSRLLIEAAYVTGYPIIVFDSKRAATLSDQARKLNYKIEVFSLEAFKKLTGKFYNKVLIDEGMDFIEMALNNYIGVPVVACTITLPMESEAIEENKEEVDK